MGQPDIDTKLQVWRDNGHLAATPGKRINHERRLVIGADVYHERFGICQVELLPLEQALGGIVSSSVRISYPGSPAAVHTVIAGLGGRAITRDALARVFAEALAGTLAPLTFLDLDRAMVERALAREREQRRSGPIAENILRDLGTVASRAG